jgi:hypothetical protein
MRRALSARPSQLGNQGNQGNQGNNGNNGNQRNQQGGQQQQAAQQQAPERWRTGHDQVDRALAAGVGPSIFLNATSRGHGESLVPPYSRGSVSPLPARRPTQYDPSFLELWLP